MSGRKKQEKPKEGMLPQSEYRRQYMDAMINEGMLLFGLNKEEAKEWATRTVIYMRAKFDHEDTIYFGTGKIYPKTHKPRNFNLYSGSEGRKTVSVGERVTWAVKFFKRWRS